MSEELQELRKEADDLGVKYAKTAGVEQLQKKIDEFYESKETSLNQVLEKVAEKEKQETSTDTVDISKNAKRLARETAAKKTRVVTIVDNDQRVNNQTTTCIATCGNEYFDLGTQIIPLNEKVEVRQGHLNTLKEIKIPQHVKDPKTKLSKVVMRSRYSIHYED